MSDVSAVSGANGSYGWLNTPGSSGGVSSLSPDGLLVYCSARLNSIDGQIGDYEKQQLRALTDKQAVQSVAAVFKQFAGVGPKTQAEWDKCQNALKDTARSLQTDDPTRQQLLDFSAKLDQQYEGDKPHFPTDAEWQGNIASLDNMATNINSAAELQMIQLQSLVSERATVVQLTTNMMSKMDQSAENIASKI